MSNSENMSAKDIMVQTANIKITDIYRKPLLLSHCLCLLACLANFSLALL